MWHTECDDTSDNEVEGNTLKVKLLIKSKNFPYFDTKPMKKLRTRQVPVMGNQQQKKGEK